MKDLKFRVVAATDAAGKYNPDAVRNGNEDNVFVDIDLSGSANVTITPNTLIPLGRLGMLMVVADGMGGMNAGEVASQIAIDTVKDAFRPGAIPAEATASPESRGAYMESVIRKADKNIKADGALNPERNGMGSTIIMAWLMPDGRLTLSWIGDSRAYVYNPDMGLAPLSEDHSYVQQLVRNGIISYEDSFDHPQNNIIVRSLGDTRKDAEPETRQFRVGKGDLIILCSDGLSGVLRDRAGINPHTGQPYPEQNLEDIISIKYKDLPACKATLWKAAEEGGWYDNVTLILCRIDEGPESHVEKETAAFEKELKRHVKNVVKQHGGQSRRPGFSTRTRIIMISTLIALAGVCCAVWYARTTRRPDTNKPTTTVTNDVVESTASDSIPPASGDRTPASAPDKSTKPTAAPAAKPGDAVQTEAIKSAIQGQNRTTDLTPDSSADTDTDTPMPPKPEPTPGDSAKNTK